MASDPIARFTEEQYLEIDRAAEFRSEFFNGQMFVMSGASLQHGRLQQNLSVELSNRLQGAGCEALPSGLRVKISKSGMYTYPDVLVVCGKPVLADEHQDILLNPVVIMEIPLALH